MGVRPRRSTSALVTSEGRYMAPMGTHHQTDRAKAVVVREHVHRCHRHDRGHHDLGEHHDGGAHIRTRPRGGHPAG